MTIEEILKMSIEQLRERNIEEPILKSKILVSNALGKEKEYLVINGEKTLEENQIKKINDGVKKLIEGMPLQYITNHQEFMGLYFYVDENVLIPQPDTEILVEEVIKIVKDMKETKDIQILDLCTGSGAIAIALAKISNVTRIIASDISSKALNVVNINCKKHKVENIEIIKSDLFNEINKKFNIIVSNPPYIIKEEIKNLSIEVQNEPLIALDGGPDGLDFYRKIINDAFMFLETDGFLCIEIGYNQKEQVIELIIKSKKYKNIYSKKDLSGNDRIVVCQKI